MRTTVTIDPDTEALLRQESRRTGHSFKQVLNEAIRAGLAPPRSVRITPEPLFSARFPPALEDANFNHAGDTWDDEATIDELSS